MVCPLLFLPLWAQDAPVLPEVGNPSPVEAIPPVPQVDLPFGADPLKAGLPDTLKLENGGIEGVLGEMVRFKGPIKLSGDGGLEVFADNAVYDLKKRTVVLEGNVSVYHANVLQRGHRAVYDVDKHHLDTRELSVSFDSIILESGKFTAEEVGGKRVFTGENAGITTHDVEDPNFWVRADRTRIYPGDKITFKNLRLFAGDQQVFWLPYLSQPLDKDLGYHFIPGARSNWGPYLLNTYGIMLGGTPDEVTGENDDAWLLSRWHLDLRTTRGLGTGVDLLDTRLEDNPNLTGLSLYYLYDINPDTERSGVPRGVVDPNRYRLELKHRQTLELPDSATWYADANLTWLSDAYYLEDFEPARYRTDPQPDNMLGVTRRDDTSLLSIYGRFQVNDFYRTGTRLPELAFDQARRPLFGTPILHEGTTSLSLLETRIEDDFRDQFIDPLLGLPPGDPRAAGMLNQLRGYERHLAEQIRSLPPGDPKATELRSQMLDTGYSRFHTFHEFSLPTTIGDFLTLTPKAGAGYSRYMNVDGPADTDDRFLLHGGVEASVKFSKSLGDFTKPGWGLDGLLHVAQPYVNWSLLTTDELPALYPQVDRYTVTTRPQTLAPERFTATDDLQDWNVVRLGMRNRLLTRRDGQSHEWLYLDTYIDAFVQDPEMDRDFSNLYNDLRVQPLPWLGFSLDTQFPVISGGSGFSEVGGFVNYQPRPDIEIALGYRWLDNHPVLLDSNRVEMRVFARLNENWGVGVQQVWEMDDGTPEVQQYTLHRDLGNWVAGVGLTRRDNRTETEYGLVFSLTLKEFPSLSVPFEIDAGSGHQ